MIAARPYRAPDAAESHYLPFNGVDDVGYVDGGLVGYTTAYAVVIKVARKPTSNAGWPAPVHLSNPGASPWPNNLTDLVQIKNESPPKYRHVCVTTAGTLQVDRQSTSGTVDGVQVLCVARDLSANLARIRVVQRDGTIAYAPSDGATSEDSAPEDVCFGGYLNPNLTLNSSPSDIWLVGLCVLHAVPTDEQLQRYARTPDARAVWSSLPGYWTASSVYSDAGTIKLRNLSRSGSGLAAVLVGPTVADLVML